MTYSKIFKSASAAALSTGAHAKKSDTPYSPKDDTADGLGFGGVLRTAKADISASEVPVKQDKKTPFVKQQPFPGALDQVPPAKARKADSDYKGSMAAAMGLRP